MHQQIRLFQAESPAPYQAVRIYRVSLIREAELHVDHPKLPYSGVVLGHNHPSGDQQPSHEDRTLTKRLVDGGKLLGIEVLDPVVLGDSTYFSFAVQGCCKRLAGDESSRHYLSERRDGNHDKSGVHNLYQNIRINGTQ